MFEDGVLSTGPIHAVTQQKLVQWIVLVSRATNTLEHECATTRVFDVWLNLYKQDVGTLNHELAHQALANDELNDGAIFRLLEELPVRQFMVEENRVLSSDAKNAISVIREPTPEGIERQRGCRGR